MPTVSALAEPRSIAPASFGQASPTTWSGATPWATSSFLWASDSIVVFVAKTSAVVSGFAASSFRMRPAPRPTISTVSTPPALACSVRGQTTESVLHAMRMRSGFQRASMAERASSKMRTLSASFLRSL